MGGSHENRDIARRSVTAGLILLVSLTLLVFPQGRTSAHPGLTATPYGLLAGQVINTRTGSGLPAAISAIGPQNWAGGSNSQGYYSAQLAKGNYEVSVLKDGIVLAKKSGVSILPNKTTTVNFQVAYTPPPDASPSPSHSSPPPSPAPEPAPEAEESEQPLATPAPDPTRRPQILTTAVGGTEPALTESNLGLYAQRYDVLTHQIPGYLIPELRRRNPDIVLLQYRQPHATQNKTLYPDWYYVKDTMIGSKVSLLDWYLLDFRQVAVRTSVVQSMVRNAPSDIDGYWMDISGPELLNTPYASASWKNSSGKVANLGDLDGGWHPLLALSTKPDYTDGTWPSNMLSFHKELAAVSPGKIRIYNGLQWESVYGRDAFWREMEGAYLSTANGVAKEGIFVYGPGSPMSEGVWRHWLNRAERVIASGKFMHFYPIAKSDAALQNFGFFSYLLLADGKYAWYFIQAYYYNTSLYTRDYGMPEGRYTVLSTPSGSVYKREFTNSTIWVNPGNVTRTVEGRSIGPKTGIVVFK